LRGGDAPVLHVLVAENTDDDQRRAREDVGSVFLPDSLEALAPQLLFDFAEKVVLLICDAGVSP
jgi:hypothetical protein